MPTTLPPRLALIMLVLVSLKAEAKPPQKSTDLLEELEQMLLEKERSQYTFGPKKAPPPMPDRSITIDGTEVDAKDPDQVEMARITKAIDEIFLDIEGYESKLLSFKQDILKAQAKDNMTTLSLEFGAAELQALHALRLTLDGLIIYEMDPSLGFWQPADPSPLFMAPLGAGSHSLKFEARLHEKANQALDFQPEPIRVYDQTFVFSFNPQSGPLKLTITIPKGGKVPVFKESKGPL